MQAPFWTWILVGAVAVALASCEDMGAEPEPAPVRIHFEPSPGALNVESCTSLEFEVLYSGEGDLSVEFWLDDALVGDLPKFSWMELPPGSYVVRAEARSSDGEKRSSTWSITAEGPSCEVEPAEPQIAFLPEQAELTVEPFASLVFRADHLGREPITVHYLLDGQNVGNLRLLVWTSGMPGQHVMRAVVQKLDGTEESMDWKIQVIDQVSTPVPVVGSLEAERLEHIGQARLSWIRTYPSLIQVPIADYLVYISASPITEPTSSMIPVQIVSDDPAQRAQSTVIENAIPGRTNHFLVVARDRMGRQSLASEPISVYVTGPFAISGTCYQLSTGSLSWAPAPGLLLGWREATTASLPDGSYRLADLSDYYSASLLINDPTDQLESMRRLKLPSMDFEMDVYALPRAEYTMEIGDQGPQAILLSRLLRIFTGTEFAHRNEPLALFHWESYPIPVHAPDLVHTGSTGELVDYRAIFEQAVARWNAATPRELFELVDTPPELGVTVHVDLLPQSGLLGDTFISRPFRSSVFQEPPEEVTIRLREFNFVSLAERIIVHELGHALLMGHSPDPSHVMNANASEAEPTLLEGTVAAILSVLPQGLDINMYLD